MAEAKKGGCLWPTLAIVGGLVVLAAIGGQQPDTKGAGRSDSAASSSPDARCPADADARLQQAIDTGAISIDIVGAGLEVYMAARHADILGAGGLDGVALHTDCAIAGDDGHAMRVTIRTARGGPVLAEYDSVALLRLRQRYAANSGQ